MIRNKRNRKDFPSVSHMTLVFFTLSSVNDPRWGQHPPTNRQESKQILQSRQKGPEKIRQQRHQYLRPFRK